MPFKPPKSSGINGYLGIKPLTIISFEEDKTKDFDVFLKVNVLQENSKFEQNLAILGNFEKGPDGIILNGLVKQINRLFEALGDSGGIDTQGNWVTEDDTIIADIGAYLTDKYSGGTDSYPYLAYFYKKAVKGKLYTQIYPYFVSNNDEGQKSLEGFIAFIKAKGVLKEVVETVEVPTTPGQEPYNGQF